MNRTPLPLDTGPDHGTPLVSDNIRRVLAPEPQITKREVEERMHEAIRILAALPDRERKWVYSRLASWPETLREAIDVMAIALERVAEGKSAYEDMRPPRIVPSAEAIDQMDKTLPWLSLLDKRERQIVTARAFHVSWVKLAAKYGRTDRTIQRWHESAIDLVWVALASL